MVVMLALGQQGGFGGAVVEEALPAGDFGREERRGEEGRVGGEAVELGEGVVHLWVGLGASEVDTAEVGNGGELRNSLVLEVYLIVMWQF